MPDALQYLALLAACLLLTLPLEWVLGARVYRRPRRLFAVLLPVVIIFLAWDLWAIAAGHWSYSSAFTVGLALPGGLPIEELLFFLAVPICGLLTFEAVERVLARSSRSQDAPPTRRES